MPRPVSPSIPEKEFLVSALQQSLRLDGRAMTALREPRLTFGPELGWVECAMGKTRFVRNFVTLGNSMIEKTACSKLYVPTRL